MKKDKTEEQVSPAKKKKQVNANNEQEEIGKKRKTAKSEETEDSLRKKKKAKASEEKLEEELEQLHLEKLPLDEVAIHEKHDSDEDFEADDMGEFYEGDDFLFDLSQLTKKELKSLKNLYPNLPEYYFKTPAEKKKFFNQMNKKYFDKLKKETPKKLENDKKVEFNTDKNQIRG